MFLSVGVMMRGRKPDRGLMVMIGVLLASARTTGFADRSHRRVSAEECHYDDNRG
jgi:hypothetical protein